MTIRWTEPAADSLERLFQYIASESDEERAAGVVNSLIATVEMLKQQPRMGRIGSYDENTRELVRPPYVIVYKIVEDVVNVVNLFHTSQMR